jgi:hypothetical protein
MSRNVGSGVAMLRFGIHRRAARRDIRACTSSEGAVVRFWKPQSPLAVGLALTAVTVMALAITPSIRLGVEALLTIFIGAALAGMYVMRRYARAALLYRQHTDRGRPAVSDREPTRNPGPGWSR